MRNRWLALPFVALFALSLASLGGLSHGTSAVADDPAGPAAATAETSGDPAETATSVWMEKKLDYTNGILRGLAMGDMEAIRTNGHQLRLLNKVEGFVRNRNPRYRTQLHLFERLTGELVVQAERNNLEGVTLAFNQMTVSCVRCHQTLRDTEQNSSAAANEEHHAE